MRESMLTSFCSLNATAQTELTNGILSVPSYLRDVVIAVQWVTEQEEPGTVRKTLK